MKVSLFVSLLLSIVVVICISIYVPVKLPADSPPMALAMVIDRGVVETVPAEIQSEDLPDAETDVVEADEGAECDPVVNETVPKTELETPEMALEQPVEAEMPIVSEPEPVALFHLDLPTDNRELFGDPSKFFMHTNRYIDGVNMKPWQGGKYGFVRNQLHTQNGVIYTRLHEGIDIRPMVRDDKKVPLDEVRAISDGVVVYVNKSASASNYGRYVVIRHDWPEGAFYSLYAHLASVCVEVGGILQGNSMLGVLGNTGAGIDRERAHLHLELNFLLSEQFETQYGYSHRNYNGLNMTGLDIARLLGAHRDNPYISIKEFLQGEEPYCKVKSVSKVRPGILQRHPWLGRNMENEEGAQCWEFTFARTGVPLAIEPCETAQKYAEVTWVKPVKTNHSNMTMGRLVGSGDKAKLSSRGHQFIKLISEAF